MSATNQTAALGFDAVLFDLDGVVTRTARLHAAAWKVLFDEFLRRRAIAGGEPFQPFDPEGDYVTYVDGRPRHEGVRSFLAARGVTVPEGAPTDGPDAVTVHGLGERRNALFTDRLRRDGVEVFASAVALIRTLQTTGEIKKAVLGASHGQGQAGRCAACRRRASHRPPPTFPPDHRRPQVASVTCRDEPGVCA